jgi:hypothetical protein
VAAVAPHYDTILEHELRGGAGLDGVATILGRGQTAGQAARQPSEQQGKQESVA